MTGVRSPGGDLVAHQPTSALAAAPDRVRLSMVGLVERFQPQAAEDLDVTVRLEIADCTPMLLHVRDGRCLLAGARRSPADSRAALDADVVFHTDVETWLALAHGHRDGIGSFLDGDLEVRGDLDLAARFETLFAPAPGGRRQLTARRTRVRNVTVDALVAGSGTPVLLLHGLGASKVSFLPTLHGLARHHEVHALDLPGHGRSSKPLPTGRRYSMAWFAQIVHGYLVANGLRDVHLVGNSMGARIALELALTRPRSVRSIGALAPAVAFDETRGLGPLLRLVRPQWLGLAPAPLPAAGVERFVRELFHDPARLPSDNLRAAAQDVVRSAGDPAFRMALLASARQLGIDRGAGRRGYWQRLAEVAPPSLWVFGAQDRLVSARYATRVRAALPHAQVQVWESMGHVPQFEDPTRTNETLRGWLADIDARAPALAPVVRLHPTARPS